MLFPTRSKSASSCSPLSADLTEGHRVTFSTDLTKDSPSIASLVNVYSGANWHEREAAEMFGIEFIGHP